jgi:hypothetical protein
MNIFDIEVYARRCEKSHCGNSSARTSAGHLRKYFTWGS